MHILTPQTSARVEVWSGQFQFVVDQPGCTVLLHQTVIHFQFDSTCATLLVQKEDLFAHLTLILCTSEKRSQIAT